MVIKLETSVRAVMPSIRQRSSDGKRFQLPAFRGKESAANAVAALNGMRCMLEKKITLQEGGFHGEDYLYVFN